jgi:hypothetical protein
VFEVFTALVLLTLVVVLTVVLLALAAHLVLDVWRTWLTIRGKALDHGPMRPRDGKAWRDD